MTEYIKSIRKFIGHERLLIENEHRLRKDEKLYGYKNNDYQ